MPTQQRILLAGLTAVLLATAVTGQAAASRGAGTTVELYDAFSAPGGYTRTDYAAKWDTGFGLGEMALEDTRRFDDGEFAITAIPFRTSADLSVQDHIKYFAISRKAFPVPERGSVEFSVELTGKTPGAEDGHVVHGTYGPPGSYPAGAPYEARLLEGQQAAATLHMMDFQSGQLFDWFVSSHRAFTLVERLPSALTDPTIPPGDERYVGRDKMYTQIVDEVPLSAGKHRFAIRFTRDGSSSRAEFLLDGRLVSKVDDVGIPLDVQGARYTGTYPSLGPGELLHDKIDAVVIGHGLFSLLDVFPFQHPEAPELSVSIPTSERIFGQGAKGTFDNFIVTTRQ